MHSIATDSDLIAVSLDDPAVFARIFDRHYVEIHGFVQRRLGTPLADRIAARVFVEAFRERATFNGRADARPWLYGIATAQIGRHHRRERRLLRAYARRGPSLMSEAPLAARERSGPRAASRALARAVARLDGPERDALLLGAWTGFERAQLAQALGCDEREARNRLAEARRRVITTAEVQLTTTAADRPIARAG